MAEGTNTYVADSLKGKRYYDGTKSHRVIKNFMLQAGDRTATGEGSPGYQFADEFVDSLKFTKKGQLAMANSGPATNGSQFFITEVATDWLTFRHTIFGQVVKGEEVISKITDEQTSKEDSRPKNPVIIKKIEIIRVGKDAQKWDAPKTFDAFMKEQDALAKKREEEAQEATKIRMEQAQRNLSLISEQEKQAKALPSGIKILSLNEGKGVKPQDGQKVLVNYAGYIRDTGMLFDSNIKEVAQENGVFDPQRAQDPQYGYMPYPWEYSQKVSLIAGFKEALLSMKVGDKLRVFIPAALAYGEQGIQGLIPPNSDLVFQIEIVDIAK